MRTLTKSMLFMTLQAAIVTTIIIFVPMITAPLGLDSLRTDYTTTLLVILLTSIVLMAVIVVGSSTSVGLSAMSGRRSQRKERETIFENLTTAQRDCLRVFHESHEPQVEFALADEAAYSLRQSDVLYIDPKHANMSSAPHRLRPWAHKMLKRTPWILLDQQEISDILSMKVQG